jgi:hypothetical protein
MAPREFWRESVELFYRIGVVGVKLETHEAFAWSTEGRRSVSTAEIRDDSRISVHPCFWRVLGINERAEST